MRCSYSLRAMEPRYQAMIFLGALSGLRIGEMIDLRRRDVDLVRKTIYVPGTKTENSRRTIRMHRLVHDALAVHIDLYVATGSADAWIFTSPRGKRLNQGNFARDFWKPARQAARQPQLHFHDLRHSAASFAAMAGAHPTAVQALLGHSRVGVTLSLYTHLWPGAVDGAIEAVDSLFAQGPRATS
jgi:integrase